MNTDTPKKSNSKPSTTRRAPARRPGSPVAAAKRTAELARMLALTALEPHWRNIRRDLGDLAELTASIAGRGVLQPLVVAPLPDPHAQAGSPSLAGGHGERFVIVAGHRRHAAAQAAGLAEVPVFVRTDLDSPEAVLMVMLAENLHRADLTAIEEACAYEQLDLAGLDIDSIAAGTGRSKTTIERRRRLLALPTDVRDRTHVRQMARQMTLAQAEALAEFADVPDLLAELEGELDNDEGDWRWELARARETLTRRRSLADLTAELVAGGSRVVTDDDLAQLGLARGAVWRHRVANDGQALDLDDVDEDQDERTDDAASGDWSSFGGRHRACPDRAVIIHTPHNVAELCL